MTVALFFAIAAFVAWGSGDIFNTIVARKSGALYSTFWLFLLGGVFSLLILPFQWRSLTLFTPPIFLLSLGLSALLVVSGFCFLQALKYGEPTVVGTITGSFVAIVVILSIVFLHEKLIPAQAAAITVIFVGLLLSNISVSALKNREVKPSKGTAYAILAMLGWGVYFTFIKVPIERVGWFPAEFIAGISGPIIIVLAAWYMHRTIPKLSHGGVGLPMTVAALLAAIGTNASNIAYQYGNVAVVAPITGSYPVLFAALAHYIFKEPLSRQQTVGIVVTLAGIVGLSFVS